MNDNEYPMGDAFESVMDDVERLTMDEDDRYRLTPEDIPTNHPVVAYEDDVDMMDSPTDHAHDPVQCGTCGLWWDDAVPTSWTPAPSARCPFEPFHRDEIDIDSYVLCVDTEIVRDVMIAVGGPTRFLRFVLSSDGEYRQAAGHMLFSADEIIRVEYHDSWAVPSERQLSSDEEQAAVTAFGFLVGLE